MPRIAGISNLQPEPGIPIGMIPVSKTEKRLSVLRTDERSTPTGGPQGSGVPHSSRRRRFSRAPGTDGRQGGS